VKQVRVGAAALLLASGVAGADVTAPLLRLTAEQRYDDDLLLRTDAAGLQGQTLTKLTPQLGLSSKGPAGTFEAWYAADFMYRETTGVARLDHRGALEWKRRLSQRTDVLVDLRLYRVSDPTSLPRVGIARSLSPVSYGKVAATLGTRLSQRWSLKVGLAAEGAQVDEPGRPPGAVVAPSVEAWWRAGRRDAVGAEVRLQAFAYGEDTSTAPGVFAGYRRDLSRGLSLTLKGGPILYRAQDGQMRGVPRITAELAQELGQVDLGLVAGNDLVGASGFTDALWAQFGSAFVNWRATRVLRFYGVANVYRNGPALTPLDGGAAEGVGTGYALEAGADWSWTRFANVQGAFTRISQVGTGAADLARNIVAVRLVLHPAN
jgi:hypothetical protein